MKKAVLFILLLIFVFAAVVLLFDTFGGRRAKIPQVGDAAPAFRLTTLDGKSVSLSELRGRVVMVHFWATWCPPCVEELPTLDRFIRSMAGREIEFLAISVDDSGPEAVREFLKKHGLTLPVLLDPDKSVSMSYGTFKYPETYLIDRQGIIRNRIIGGVDWGRPEARGLIEELLKN